MKKNYRILFEPPKAFFILLLTSLCLSFNQINAQVCTADAGTITADASPVSLSGGSATITATPDGNSAVPADYEVTYVLTSGTGLVIEAAGAAPSFTVNAAGDYTIHTLVAETSDNTDPNFLDLGVIVFGTTTGVDVLNLVAANSICASLDVPGAPIVVEDDLSIDDNRLAESFKLVSNPVRDILRFENRNNISIESIEIYDLSGRLIRDIISNNINTNIEVDVSGFSDGYYITRVSSESGNITLKWIKH
ncbi:T9SS type A sorting domain-containing protein [Winogradskyella sp.]|uniref:T9SS type A sorting domain-containing protein n=1 Tax=Winogradskyella sp. TaxID=1883156 RepID=UPI0026273337|nr:T9SS type A sorting domain-containing protein [Winogradskyella sp.]